MMESQTDYLLVDKMTFELQQVKQRYEANELLGLLELLKMF